LNEVTNLEPLVAALDRALRDVAFEIVVVDDNSPDYTAAFARRMAQRDPRMRVVERIGRSGLASAVIEGVLASSAPYIAVIECGSAIRRNADPRDVGEAQKRPAGHCDRHAKFLRRRNGNCARSRVRPSHAGKWLSVAICGATLSDPMSGFFVLRRTFFDEVVHRLSGVGFKILVDIMTWSGGQFVSPRWDMFSGHVSAARASWTFW
jgi:dolichol-phosphate mannosyltransferase